MPYNEIEMAKTKQLTPLDKKRPGRPTLDKPHRDLVLPSQLLARKVTSGSLAKGNFQKQILSFFATTAAPVLMNGLIRNAKQGDTAAMRLLAEIYSFTQKGGGVNLLVQQNNNQSNSRDSGDDGVYSSFENIVRDINEKRRQALPAIPVVFEATPEE